MSSADDRAESLTRFHSDRFAEMREEAVAHCAKHGCQAMPAPFLRARELGVLVRAMHASYVLELGTGLGYVGLHIMDAFGRTGRLDTVERDPGHAGLAEANFRRFAFAERVRVHSGRATDVVPALSGPYDLITLDADPAGHIELYEHLLRLVRTSGSIIVSPGADGEVAPALLSHLAEDDRVLPSFGPGLRHAVVVRLR